MDLFQPKPQLITLRPYQRQAVDAVYAHLRDKDDNPCVVIPTGGGKTPVIATICSDAVNLWSGRVLILAHVKELLQQASEKLTAVCPNVDVGLYSAAYRLVMLAVIPINALVTSSYRTFVDPAVGQHFRRAAKYTLATTVYCTVTAGLLILVAPFALPLVVGDGFDGAVSITRWLAPLMIVRGFTHFPLNAIMGLGHPRVRLVCIAVSATVAMGIYVVLIPSMSWKGAVIGSYVSDTVLAVLAWVMLWRVRNDWRQVGASEPVGIEPEVSSAG